MGTVGNSRSGNSSQEKSLAEGSITPLTDVTHMERYSFGGMPNIDEKDTDARNGQYRYYVGSTDKFPSFNASGFNYAG